MSTTKPKTISLDRLIALNDEIVALTRSGLSLDKGLIHLGEDLPGQLGRLAASIGYRLEAGESLPAAFASSHSALPSTYQAVIEAGLRSGRLTAALEGVSQTARRTANFRRTFLLVTVYPMIIFTIAYGLMVLGLMHIVPGIIEGYRGLAETDPWWARWLAAGSASVRIWAPWPLLIGYLVYAMSLFVSTRAEHYHGHPWIPTLARLRAVSRMAVFTDLLSLLVQQEVPLPKSLILAGHACGSRALKDGAKTLADQLQTGQRPAGIGDLPRGVPPLLAWAVTTQRPGADLNRTLQSLASVYHARANRMLETLSTIWPVALTAIAGGLLVVVYAVVVLGPFVALLYRFSTALPR